MAGAGAGKAASGGKTAAKAAGAIAAGGGPEDPVGDAAAAAIVAKDTVASQGAQQGAKDTAKKVSESGGAGGGKDKAPAKGSGGKKGPAPKSKTKRAVRFAFSPNRRVLTGQFIACMAVVILGTLMSPSDSKDTAMRGLIKASALSGVFFLLALIAAGGPTATKTATALGTLVTASYVLTSSDVHNVVSYVAGFFKKPKDDAGGDQ